MNHNIILFHPADIDIVADLKKQGPDICRQTISKKWICGSLDNFTFGFVHRKKRGRTAYYVSSFILCKKMTDDNIDVKLICSRPTCRDGVRLIRHTEAYLRESGFKVMSLFSLPDYNLVKWYKDQGLIVKAESRDPKTYEMKTYYMEKSL
jgi:hypothetical protein